MCPSDSKENDIRPSKATYFYPKKCKKVGFYQKHGFFFWQICYLDSIIDAHTTFHVCLFTLSHRNRSVNTRPTELERTVLKVNYGC